MGQIDQVSSTHCPDAIRQPSTTKTVTWIDVEKSFGSCHSLKLITHESIICLDLDEEQSSEDLDEEKRWLQGFSPKDSSCCFAFLREIFMPPDDSLGGTLGNYGYLWKYASNRAESPEELVNMNNWRRRLCFLRDHQVHGRILAYISEKEDGSLQVAAVLSSHRKVARLHRLPVSRIKALSDPDRLKVQKDLRDYDVAFRHEDPRGKHDEDYMVDVPSQLHPCAIEWEDTMGEMHRVLLADSDPEILNRWMTYMAGKDLPDGLRDQSIRVAWENAVSKKYGGGGISFGQVGRPTDSRAIAVPEEESGECCAAHFA